MKSGLTAVLLSGNGTGANDMQATGRQLRSLEPTGNERRLLRVVPDGAMQGLRSVRRADRQSLGSQQALRLNRFHLPGVQRWNR
jgi:hypothetical protein